jgi:uncharacterized protein YkwD
MARSTTSISRFAAVIVGLALFASGLLATNPFVRSADAAASLAPSLSKFDANLLTRINKVRAAHGMSALKATAGTTDVAHGWTCEQASKRLLMHNGRLGSQLETHGSELWNTYSENVGKVRAGATAKRLFKAYMNSPVHRSNILDPSNRFVGLWSKKGGHYRYNTIDFVGSTSAAYDTDYGTARKTC